MKTILIITKKGIYLGFLILSSLLFSCEKDKDPLEACRLDPTCEYFTCKVNGVRWEPQCDGGPLFGCTPWDLQYYDDINWMILVANNENLNQSFVIYVEVDLITEGSVELFSGENSSTIFINSKNETSLTDYKILKTEQSNFRVIRYDSNTKYIKGEFSFIAQNDGGEKKVITNGEFNLPYRF